MHSLSFSLCACSTCDALMLREGLRDALSLILSLRMHSLSFSLSACSTCDALMLLPKRKGKKNKTKKHTLDGGKRKKQKRKNKKQTLNAVGPQAAGASHAKKGGKKEKKRKRPDA